MVDLETYSETWPQAGSMRNGACSVQPAAERRISERGSSLWLPTPAAVTYGTQKSQNVNAEYRPSLETMARKALWPTPKARDHHVAQGSEAELRRSSPDLNVVVKVPKLWPTPRAASTGGGPSETGPNVTHSPSLQTAVRFWPTPRAQDGSKGGSPTNDDLPNAARMWRTPTVPGKRGGPQTVQKRLAGGHTVNLEDQVKTWPTPTAGDSKGGPGNSGREGGLNLRTAVNTGQLNPTWVEWLMGWPSGWTDLEPLATASFRQWRREHGAY